MIVYVKFAVSLRGLELASEEDLERLRLRLDSVVREYVHPAGYSNMLDSDVEVEIDERE